MRKIIKIPILIYMTIVLTPVFFVVFLDYAFSSNERRVEIKKNLLEIIGLDNKN